MKESVTLLSYCKRRGRDLLYLLGLIIVSSYFYFGAHSVFYACTFSLIAISVIARLSYGYHLEKKLEREEHGLRK